MPTNTTNTPNVERVAANIFLVDPNPPGMDMIPPEDMFIYVKFSAYERNRSDLVETIGEINFIATEVNYNAKGEIDPSPQKTYATTNYSKIGGTVDANSRGVLEGFGIKSIDIKYDASLVPQVDITFTDVRGASLFDVIDNDNRKSPYSIFFKMPYPIFKLSVKGYFGKTVDYCLHMTNWTSNFDGSTGNFDISANFVGFQQAFLADMVVGNIIGAVNTEIGANKLTEIFAEQERIDPTLEKIDTDVIQLDDFLVRISKLQLEFEDIKENNDPFKVLRSLNELNGKLSRLQSFIGIPLLKDVDNDTNIEYLNQKNKSTQVETSPINDNSLVLGRDYLSIRDYLLVNSIRVNDIKEYFNTLKDITQDYRDFLINQSQNTTGANSGMVTEKSQESLLDSFKLGPEYSYEKFLWDQGKTPQKLEAVFNIFNSNPNNGGVLNLGPPPANNNSINDNFNPTLYFNTPQLQIERKQNMSLDNNVLVFDMREIRSQVQNTIINLKESIKTQQEEVQKSLNESLIGSLKFSPNIKNVFRIICNNTDAMLLSLKELKNNVNGSNSQDKRKQFIVKTYGEKNSDLPVKFNEFMWPTVYQGTDDKGSEEIYLGTAENIDIELFPEVKFVEDVFTNLAAKRKNLNQITKATAAIGGNDTDNWFPINPIDYEVNPFLKLNVLNNNKEINSEITKQIVERICIIKNYSNLTKSVNNTNALSSYATLDGINANKTIFSKVIRDFIETNLLESIQKPIDNIINTAISDGLMSKNNNVYTLTTPPISKEEYIILNSSTTSKIVNNSKRLWSDISNNKYYTTITDYKNATPKTYYQWYYNNNLTSNLFNHIWATEVNDNLIKTDSDNKNYNINDIEVIDPKGEYINILNPIKPSTDTTLYPELLTDNDFYNNLTQEGKALLLLSTFPFTKFTNVLDVIKDKTQAQVLSLPTLYLYYIGGLLARLKNDFLSGWNTLSTPKEQYINKIGGFSKSNGVVLSTSLPNIESELTNLPTQTKEILINYFQTWVSKSGSGGFLSFEKLVKTYKTSDLNISEQDKKDASKSLIKNSLNKLTNVVLTAPTSFFDPNTPKAEITREDISQYLTGFENSFKNTVNDKGKNTNTSTQNLNTNDTENAIKLQIYNYFKNINNKWVTDDNKQQQVCGANNQLFDYFKFIDRGWADIGDKAVINLDSLLGLSNDLNTSVYFLIAKILRDSNFLFQILPTFINYKDNVEVSEIFKPITNVNESNRSRGPAYVCIYAGGNSEVLDIGENTTYSYPNDGFSFANKNIPSDFNSDNSLVAFKVGFGAENQTIFKNVSLSQQEHRETAEYFKALTDLIDKKGGTQRSYQGSDLLRLFKTRSYTCKVDAMGCMNIQPLMYFDLQNVPFFNGAYLITNVNHNITPNTMSTNFSGVRQSKFITSYVDKPTAFLNVDLEEDLQLPDIEFTNNNTNNPIYSIGVDEESQDQDFDFTQLTDEILTTQLGVTTTNRPTTQFMKDQMVSNGIITNSEVTMFLSNVLVNSDNFEKTERISIENMNNIEESIVKISGETQYYSGSGDTFTNTGNEVDIVYNPDDFKGDNENKDLGNTKIGDGFRYRNRGYLYIKGKTQYEIFEKGAYKTIPYEISDIPDVAFLAAIYVWKNVKDNNNKSSNQYAHINGNSPTFERTIEISCPTKKEKDNFYLKFEKVLTAFSYKNKPLISYDRP